MYVSISTNIINRNSPRLVEPVFINFNQHSIATTLNSNNTQQLKAKRLQQIADIDHYISSTEGEQILTNLDWSKDELFKDNRIQNAFQTQSKAEKRTDELQDYYLLPCERKLELYQKSLENDDEHYKRKGADMTDMPLQSSTLDIGTSSKSRAHGLFADINKLKRDLKRRRMKYRTTKALPLTYTEELKELIGLQMEMIDKME